MIEHPYLIKRKNRRFLEKSHCEHSYSLQHSVRFTPSDRTPIISLISTYGWAINEIHTCVHIYRFDTEVSIRRPIDVHRGLSCCITFERHWDRKVDIRTQRNSCMVSHIIQHCWHVETVIIKRLSLRLAVYFPQIYRSLYSRLLGTRPLAILLALHRPSPIRLLLLACVWYYLSAQGNQCQARSDVGN